MKRVLQMLAAVVLAAGFSNGVAQAALNCTISNTGPGSTNTCTTEDDREITFTCENGILINNDTNQEVTTGDAEVIDSTTGGGASSGDASNSNKTLVEVVIACGESIAQNPEPTPGGDGGGNGGPVAPGGRGGGEAEEEVDQVNPPVGGVNAGVGGAAASGLLATLLGGSAASGAIAIHRLRKLRAEG